VGNWAISPYSPPDLAVCGNRGCLEALAFGTAIARRAQKVAIEQPDSLLGRFAEERAPLGEDVLDLTRKGDDAAIKLLRESGIWFGIGLATFVNMFDPEAIAIGGGVSEAGDLVLELARRELRLRSHSPSRSGRDKGGPPGSKIGNVGCGRPRPKRRRRVRARETRNPPSRGSRREGRRERKRQ